MTNSPIRLKRIAAQASVLAWSTTKLDGVFVYFVVVLFLVRSQLIVLLWFYTRLSNIFMHFALPIVISTSNSIVYASENGGITRDMTATMNNESSVKFSTSIKENDSPGKRTWLTMELFEF